MEFHNDNVEINGIYYTVVNGYTKRTQGKLHIRYGSLLSVCYVKRRLKNVLFVFILVGSVLSIITSYLMSKMKLLRFINEIGASNTLQTLLTVIAVFFLFCMFALFFSKQPYIEISYIGGVVRIPCFRMGKLEAMELIAIIRSKI